MLEIRYSKQEKLEVSGSAQQLSEVAMSIYQFLESEEKSIVFEANRSIVPAPYDYVISHLRVEIGTKPAKAILTNREVLLVQGSRESLRAFASLFEFEPSASHGDHSHFEYEAYEGNRFVSPGSMAIVISVR